MNKIHENVKQQVDKVRFEATAQRAALVSQHEMKKFGASGLRRRSRTQEMMSRTRGTCFCRGPDFSAGAAEVVSMGNATRCELCNPAKKKTEHGGVAGGHQREMNRNLRSGNTLATEAGGESSANADVSEDLRTSYDPPGENISFFFFLFFNSPSVYGLVWFGRVVLPNSEERGQCCVTR